MEEERSEHHDGEELIESVEREAERLIAEVMRAMGWTESDGGGRRKADHHKVRMEASLRARTTVCGKWIAEKLRLGHWQSGANAVRRRR